MNEDEKAQEARIEKETAELHAELAVGFPESYAWEEKRVVCEDMDDRHGSESDIASGLRNILLGQLPGPPSWLTQDISTKSSMES